MKDTKAESGMDSTKKKKSFAERRQTITLQMEKMIREVKSKYRKRFIFVIALIVLIIIAFIVYAIVAKVTAKDICHEEVCKEIAENIYQNMDLDVDPCEDFYSYTCGGWIKNNPRPEKEEYWSVLRSLKTNVMERLKVILEDDEKSQNLSLAMIKAQNFFKSCLDTETRDKTALEGLRYLFRQIGGYPLIDNSWNDRSYDWQNSISHLMSRQSRLSPFFTLESKRDKRNNFTTRIMVIGIPRFTIGAALNSDYHSRHEKQEQENKYRNIVKQILTVFGVNVTGNSERAIDRDIDGVIELEDSLNKAADNKTGPRYAHFSVNNVSQHINFDLEEIMRNVLKQLNFPGNYEFDDTVIIDSVDYLTNLGNILKRTPKRVIANYIGTRVALEFGVATIAQLEHLMTGKQLSYQDFVRSCYWKTETYFRQPIHQLYIDTYFKPGALDKLREFVKHLKASLTLTLQMNDWMDDETKLKAQHKLNKMLDVMATPQKGYSDYYADLGYMESSNYFKNYMKILRFQAKKSLSLDPRSSYGVTTINAFYSPYENRIEVTPGILQPPVYYTDSPIVMNFAAIGTIIGHEITHGFDDRGSKYDAEGRFKNWWANETREKYEEKVKCFIDQYTRYTEPKSGLRVNGTTTIGDNIADNGGIQQAYRAYKLYSTTEDDEMDLRLPGDMSQFTPEQLFFISYGNLWCENHSKIYATEMIRYDDHAPARFRSIVPLSNSEAFAKAFNCKSGSRMNPTNKCLLW